MSVESQNSLGWKETMLARKKAVYDAAVVKVGQDEEGKDFFIDFNKTPHLLVAGTTGAGKSNLFHLIICKLIKYQYDVFWDFVLIDPKRIEFDVYRSVPDPCTPTVANTIDDALEALNKVVIEINRRRLEKEKEGFFEGAHILVIIDEFSDLMCARPEEVENTIIDIIRNGVEFKVFLIISTSSPREEVYTKRIIDAFSTKIGGHLSNAKDSLTVLGTARAIGLKGEGDLIFIASKESEPIRFQADYLSYENIVELLDPEYICELRSYESLNLIQKLARNISQFLP